jgi:hypothetical protein
MSVVCTWSGTLLRMNIVGTNAPLEIIRAFETALARPEAAERFSFLVDVSRSESIKSRSPEEIRLVAEALGPYADRIGGRCAVVATEGVRFGLSRMGSVFSGGVGVDAQVFLDEAAALTWLGIPETSRG